MTHRFGGGIEDGETLVVGGGREKELGGEGISQVPVQQNTLAPPSVFLFCECGYMENNKHIERIRG